MCIPGVPLAMWLDHLPDGQRRAAEAVLAVARKQRGLVIEAVSVGVFIKRERNIIELRPRKRWLDMSLITAARIASDRISRAVELPGGVACFVRLRDAADVDREVRGWIAAALRP